MYVKANGTKRAFENVKNLSPGRRDAGAGDERPGEFYRVDHALKFTKVMEFTTNALTFARSGETMGSMWQSGGCMPLS